MHGKSVNGACSEICDGLECLGNPKPGYTCFLRMFCSLSLVNIQKYKSGADSLRLT